jgi:hypothetical protein
MKGVGALTGGELATPHPHHATRKGTHEQTGTEGRRATTLNAVINALGALVFATVRALPAKARADFARDLARLAQQQSDAGLTTNETLLIDLHRAAQLAAESKP